MELSVIGFFLMLLSVIGQSPANSRGEEQDVTSAENEVVDALENWEAPERIRKRFPYYLSGFDYENRPVWIIEYGKWDIRKLVEKGGQDLVDFDMYIQQGLKLLVHGPPSHLYPSGEEQGEGTVIITDAEGFSLSQLTSPATVRYMFKLAGFLRDVQESLAYGYFINLNYFAETALNLLRPVLGTTMERVEVFGNNPGKWIPRILRNIPPSQIPEWYGGAKNFTPVAVYG